MELGKDSQDTTAPCTKAQRKQPPVPRLKGWGWTDLLQYSKNWFTV